MPPALAATLVLLASLLAGKTEEPLAVSQAVHFTHDTLPITIVAATLSLPDSSWELDLPIAGLTQVQVLLEPSQDLRSRRLQQIDDERQLRNEGFKVRQPFSVVRDHAEQHEGKGPAAWTDLDPKEPWLRTWLDENAERYLLLPNVPIPDAQAARKVERRPLILELEPRRDDGLHWVCFQDGRSERIAVDHALLAAHGRTLHPAPSTPPAARPRATQNLSLKALRTANGPKVITLSAHDPHGERRAATLDLDSLPTGDEEILVQWSGLRSHRWNEATRDEQPPLQAFFDSRLSALYGGEPFLDPRDRNRSRNRNRQVDLFGLLGGQPALRETLQMELLGGFGDDGGERSIDVQGIDGVEVAEHPFEEMLHGRKVDVPPLALEAPTDRFFLHVRSPRSIQSWLETGSPWLQQVGALVTGNDLHYDLATRYARALGLDAQWMRRFLESGVIRELAVLLPDFFFVDGTDLTVLCEVERSPVLDTLLNALGVSEGEVRQLDTLGGDPCYWWLDGSRLVLSTSAQEMALVQELRRRHGENSLGASTEFRCMLAELPPRSTTDAYAYFSDPFLRRLTGPEVKIGQLRRAREASRMQAIAGAQLLAAMDGAPVSQPLDRLVDLHYLPDSFRGTDLVVDAKGRVRSPRWGPLERLRPLSAQPVTQVTETEREAYSAYVENYTRYWREFFDPIAIRLDRKSDGSQEVTTFILPLLDSSVYEVLRQILPNDRAPPLLLVPRFERDPVLQISMQLADAGILQFVGEAASMLSEVQLDPMFWDLLGPQLHLSVWDDQPILRTGSGNLLGALNVSNNGFGDDFIPLLALGLTVFTRPCDLCIEVQDPDAVRTMLDDLVLGALGDDWFSVNTYRIAAGPTDHNERVISLSVAGLIQLDFSLRVEDDLLIVSNHPFGDRVPYVERRPIGERGFVVELHPDAVNDGLLGAFASLQEARRRTVFRGMARLLPFLWAGEPDVGSAQRRHLERFGFEPHFGDSAVPVWKAEGLFSPEYGTVHDPLQTRDPPSDSFGALGTLSELQVSAQLEQTGLRTVVRWRMR